MTTTVAGVLVITGYCCRPSAWIYFGFKTTRVYSSIPILIILTFAFLIIFRSYYLRMENSQFYVYR